MKKDNEESIMYIISKLRDIDYINPEDIPNIDLYMDQVTTFMDARLASCKRSDDDKILTKTMINNYTKNNLLPPPEKKKYSKDHLILLTMIFYLKNIISINDIDTALSPLIKDYFNDGNNSLEEIFKLFIQYMKDTDDNQSIIDAYVKSNEYFSNLDNENNKEYLQTLTLIATLTYECLARKMIIEKLIDSLTKYQNSKDKSDKNKSDKNKTDKQQNLV